MFSDEDLLPISALQHLVFCERQCALICLEQVWAENRLTVEGRQLHDRAHSAGDERRGRVWIVRGLPLRSLALGLVGKADVVEFAPPEGRTPPHLPVARLFAHFRQLGAQKWRVTPVEYKRGRPKIHPCDRVQLCAQALCLEEMLGVAIPAGVLFYGRTRRRLDVAFDSTLRSLVESSARRLHELIAAGRTPPAAHEAKCDACSLRELCLPKAMAGRTNA
ncbi:MAG: CRISPR-associated protein Cas4, partial [Thermoguttaceae bacterium]